jgi:hypothetical protein
MCCVLLCLPCAFSYRNIPSLGHNQRKEEAAKQAIKSYANRNTFVSQREILFVCFARLPVARWNKWLGHETQNGGELHNSLSKRFHDIKDYGPSKQRRQDVTALYSNCGSEGSFLC